MRRDESALFFTGDENLVELAGVVEYRLTLEGGVAALIFGVKSIDAGVCGRRPRGRFARRWVGPRSKTSWLRAKRKFESEVEATLKGRLAATGLPVAVDRVRVTDAHPPREVVPAYRDVSAAVSDAARYRNEAEAYAVRNNADGRHGPKAKAKPRHAGPTALGHRLKTRAEGDRQCLPSRGISPHTAQPDLDLEFRMLWDTLSLAYAGRPKLVLDPKAGGRRHVWLADPATLGIAKAVATPPQPPVLMEPED